MKNKFFFSAMLVLLAFGLTLISCAGTTKSPEERKAAALANEAAALKALNSDFSVGTVKVEGANLHEKLTWLKDNAKNGGNYILEIYADEEICGSKAAASNVLKGNLLSMVPGVSGLVCNLSFKDSNIIITFRGVGANRTISTGQVGSIFNVGSGVTLILDDNITLQGRSTMQVFEIEHTDVLVNVRSGGMLIMNNGSTITGNHASSMNGIVNKGGGVHVSDGGTFIMKGGTIARNRVSSIKPNFNASTKDQLVFDARSCGHGGGVYVGYDSGIRLFGENQTSSTGTFIKTGGTITGYSSDPSNGNAVLATPDGSGGVINGCGHAIFFDGKEPKAMDNTIGPEYSFNYSNGTFKEIQNEPKPQEAIAEPESNNYEPSVNSSVETPLTQQEALQEYQAEIQKNPAAQQEAVQKYQKALQEAQLELQEAAKKYQETMQNKR